MSQTLMNLYLEHKEKRSDKWYLYLNVYEEFFKNKKSGIKNIFEIGVQNGGSLELWSKYFVDVNKILGCDINPECSKLNYANDKINVWVDDANKKETVDRVCKHFPEGIDLIIDDGSHTSKDIITSFSEYFRLLNHDRVMVIEDLHCSYWQEFGGGLYDPMSSLSFLKKLADIVNYEHWGIDNKSRKDLLKEFEDYYQVQFEESLLEEIHCVYFYNSICIIEKRIKNENILGERVIAGEIQNVSSLTGAPTISEALIQNNNYWSALSKSPALLFLEAKESNRNYEKIIDDLKKELFSLNEKNSELEVENHTIKNSFSWRISRKIKKLIGCK